MADQPDIKRLELRITELENLLKGLRAAPAPAAQDITADEIKTFMKVSSALSTFEDLGCGINECRPLVCRVCVCRICRVCRVCIAECTCGPCIVSGGTAGGGFSGFGD